MYKKRLALIGTLLSVLILAACGQFVREDMDIQLFGYSYYEDVPGVVTLENDHLRLEYFTDTAQIIVTELATGNVWRTTPYNAINEQAATHVTRMHMLSLFALEFEDQQGVGMTMDAFRFSIDNGYFRHDIVDGGLELSFTVGDVPEIFFIPQAVPEYRLRYWLDQMEPADRRQVEEAYRLYDFSRLRPADDVNDLLSRFPTLEEENVFSLRDATPGFLRGRIEAIFANLGYTIDDFYHDLAYFNLESGLDNPTFNLVMRFDLEDNAMVVSIPFDRITHKAQYLPTRLFVLPFFGAGNPANNEGYVFLPDGQGALIHFDNGRFNQLVYSNNVWGWDAAVQRDIVIHDNRAAFPVFGVHKDDQTFVAIIEEGASYAAIRSEVSGMSGPYTSVAPNFRLIHGESLNIAGRSDRPFLLHERQLPEGESIVIRYIFTDNGYVGMAHAYREWLQARYPQLNQRVSTPMSAAVEILGAVETTQHILGFPAQRPLALTTYAAAASMMQEFHDMGWANLNIKMRGAHNDSIDHRIPDNLRLIGALGGRSGFNNMVNTANSLGFNFFLEGDFVHMRNNGMFDTFNISRDGARHVNRERAESLGHSPIFFSEHGAMSVFADPNILASPAYTQRLVRDFVASAADNNVNNIAFRTLASSLGGDFHENRHVTREASMLMRSELLAELSDQGTGIWLNYGFSYGFPFADIITGMPMSDQGFGVTDAAVPFLQIALHGLVPFAGAPLNLAEDYSYHLLKTIEGGGALFFSFMQEPTAVLHDTAYRRYFANEYDRWIGVANNLYQNHRNNFGHLYNQLIVDHEILAHGVTVTVYEDGTRVYVNTSMADFENGVVTVPSRRYVVSR